MLSTATFYLNPNQISGKNNKGRNSIYTIVFSIHVSMDVGDSDLYEDLRLINFWFWTVDGFRVQTAEYKIHDIATTTISDVKRSLPKDIYKPPAGFDGDPYHEFWRQNCLVYDGMLVEDNATVAGDVLTLLNLLKDNDTLQELEFK